MIFAVILVLALMITLNALYVAAEFATVNSRKGRIAELASNGNRLARGLLPILTDRALLDRYIAACQVGITLSSLIVGYYGQAQLTPVVAPLLVRLGVPEAGATSITVTGLLLGLTFLQVIFGELVPKSVALRFPERMAMAVILPVRWSQTLLRPLIALLNGSAHLILKRFARAGLEESHVHHPDELEVVFKESADGGLIDAGEREMLTRVFHLNERVARQIMVPRTRLVTVPVDAKPAELVRKLVDSTHTRFPVYGETIDDIEGIVHLRDLYSLARRDREGSVRSILHPVPVVPEFLSVTEVWARMRREHATMSVIFDEYGGIVGIITVEDVLEELFGEFQDEFDEEEELYREESEGRIILRGDLLVSDVNERFLLALPEEPADTIAGLIMDRLERAAREGDEVAVEGVRLRVLEVDGQAIARVLLSADEGEENEEIEETGEVSEQGANGEGAASRHRGGDASGGSSEERS